MRHAETRPFRPDLQFGRSDGVDRYVALGRESDRPEGAPPMHTLRPDTEEFADFAHLRQFAERHLMGRNSTYRVVMHHLHHPKSFAEVQS